jgi:hypothetical protein
MDDLMLNFISTLLKSVLRLEPLSLLRKVQLLKSHLSKSQEFLTIAGICVILNFPDNI